MNDDEDFQDLVSFVSSRIKDRAVAPPVIEAAQNILAMAERHQDECWANYYGGYADCAEDALRAIAGIWRYHPSYNKTWAHDGYQTKGQASGSEG